MPWVLEHLMSLTPQCIGNIYEKKQRITLSYLLISVLFTRVPPEQIDLRIGDYYRSENKALYCGQKKENKRIQAIVTIMSDTCCEQMQTIVIARREQSLGGN